MLSIPSTGVGGDLADLPTYAAAFDAWLGAHRDVIDEVTRPVHPYEARVHAMSRMMDRLFVDSDRENIDSKSDALKAVVKGIREGVRTMFTESDWLSKKSKANLIRKLDKLQVVYSYPKWLVDDRLLDKFYATRLITTKRMSHDGYFENLKSILQWDFSDLTLFNRYTSAS